MGKKLNSEEDLIISTNDIVTSALGHPSSWTPSKRKILKDSLSHLISSMKYNTPTDRCLHFEVSVFLNESNNIEMAITIIPCYRGVARGDSDIQVIEELNRRLLIQETYNCKRGDFLPGGFFQKSILWTLQFYGLTLMYNTSYSEIRIENVRKPTIKIT